MLELPSECGIKISPRPVLDNDLLEKYQRMISSVKGCEASIFYYYFKKEWDMNDLTGFSVNYRLDGCYCIGIPTDLNLNQINCSVY